MRKMNILPILTTAIVVLAWCYFSQGIGQGIRIRDALYSAKRYFSQSRFSQSSDQAVQIRDTWHSVDAKNSAYVFSAYHDERLPLFITIIGFYTGNESFFCQLWYTPHSFAKAAAKCHGFSGHVLRYRAGHFRCKLPNTTIPLSVSLVPNGGQSPNFTIPITQIKSKMYERNFTVCLKPLNSRYGRAYELVEWVEINRFLGAEKFIVYNYSSEPNVGKVLDEYARQGIVEVVQWQIPQVDFIYDFGLTASINDCLHRVREKSKYLVFVDIDEFIISHSKSSMCWMDMLKELPSRGAYYFKNVFFRKEWNNTETIYSGKETAEKLRLVILLKTKRERRVLEPIIRSKYIARTDSVDDLANHHVPQMSGNKGHPYVVPTENGYSHHYRNWQKYNDDQPSFIDEIMITKYKDLILEKVSEIWAKLENVK